MSKSVKRLIVFAIIALILAAVALFSVKDKEVDAEDINFIAELSKDDIQSISVKNKNSTYEVALQNGSWKIDLLAQDITNSEYTEMLINEATNIQYETLVEDNSKDLSIYGLENPESVVTINLKNGSNKILLIGNEEPVSSCRYAKLEDDSKVYLIKQNRTIRFTMPVEKYINYIIIQPNKTQAILNELKNITISGKNIESPIVIKAVSNDDDELMNQALSYGAITHLMVSPNVHEVNQTTLIEIADNLMGLISNGIVDYNCTDEKLAEYGFDNPDIRYEADIYDPETNKTEHQDLKIVNSSDGWIATLNNQGVVYKILDLPFENVSYNDLVLSWLVSPLILDVNKLSVEYDGQVFTYDINCVNAKELTCEYDGKEINSDLFRNFYNLVVSAQIDDPVEEDYSCEDKNELLKITFSYNNSNKADDVIVYYSYDYRKAACEVNGNTEFTINDNYIKTVINANQSLVNNEAFESSWH